MALLVLALSVCIGLAIATLNINPIKALYWTAVINGIAAGPILVVMMLISTNPKIMGDQFTASPYLKIMGWLTAGVMLAAAIAMFAFS